MSTPRDYVLHTFRGGGLHLDYAKELNEQQHAAVVAPPGPALVIAGAGAGKTRALTYRVAFLLEQGIPADRILLLTFTNKASKEMMRRVTELLPHHQGGLWGGTFHSVGHRILRRHAPVLGFRQDFTILDREDSRALLGTVYTEFNLSPKEKDFPKPEVVLEILSLAANLDQTVSQIIEKRFEYFLEIKEEILRLGEKYRARKQADNVMDFDDLQTLWLRLLRESEEARALYQSKFRFILVDEYQDTNTVQGALIDLLAQKHRNLMVVGDDSQSIYGWRGADYRNILDFPKRYPEALTYKIEVNYRSTPEILSLANAVIASNIHQFTKRLQPVKPSGDLPVLVACMNGDIQAQFVAQRVAEIHEGGESLQEIAVLYRSHFHALELQLHLTRVGIPFSITSGIRFFEQAHIKDVAAHLKFLANPNDELSFRRIVLMLPGVGPKAADKLWSQLQPFLPEPEFLPPDPSIEDHDDIVPSTESSLPGVAVALQKITKSVPRKAQVAWAQLTTTLAQMEALLPAPTARIELFLEAYYEDYVKQNYEKAETRLEDLQQLAQFAGKFPSMEEFLSQLALLSNIEAEEETDNKKQEEGIRLSTVHQAKGLEFNVVFVIMLSDGAFPTGRSLEDESALEEERRLFYVAVTRARRELYLSYPLLRRTGGYGSDSLQRKSRFLDEIPMELMQVLNLREY